MDKSVIRRLPEEFLELLGTPHQRALLIVYQHWGAYPEQEQDELAQTLLAILGPLATSHNATVPNAMRDKCEQAVTAWEIKALATDKPRASNQQQIAASPPRQVRFVSAKIEPLTDDSGFGARVTLHRSEDDWCVGFAQCGKQSDQLRATAEAALDALRQAVPERGLRLELRDVGGFEVCGHSGVLVSMMVSHREKSWPLIGLCAVTKGDQVAATALAVLNGTNRLLRTG